METEIGLLVKAGKRRLYFLIGTCFVLLLLEINIYFTFEKYSDKIDLSKKYEKINSNLTDLIRLSYESIDSHMKIVKSIKDNNKILDINQNFEKYLKEYEIIFSFLGNDNPPLYLEYDAQLGKIVYVNSRNDFVKKWQAIKKELNLQIEPNFNNKTKFKVENSYNYYSELLKQKESNYYKNEDIRLSFLICEAYLNKLINVEKFILEYKKMPDDVIKKLTQKDKELLQENETKINDLIRNISSYNSEIIENEANILNQISIYAFKKQIKEELNNSVKISELPISITSFMPITPILIACLYHWFFIYLRRIKMYLLLYAKQENIFHVQWIILFREPPSVLSTLCILFLPLFYSLALLFISFFVITPLTKEVGIDYTFPLITNKSYFIGLLGIISSMYYINKVLEDIFTIFQLTQINRTLFINEIYKS